MLKKAASVFVQTLKNHGVDRFFCVPGESYLSVMDELLYSPGIEVVTCRHEGGAGFMAAADAKCTGKAGVAFVKFRKAALTAPPTIKNGSGEWLIAPFIETIHPLFLDKVGQNAFDNLTAL